MACAAVFGFVVVAALTGAGDAQAQDSASVYAIARQYSPAARITYRSPTTSYAPSDAFIGRDAARGRRISTTLTLSKDGEGNVKVGDDSLTVATAYCVRTCDGFFFPVANAGSGSSAAHEAACARTCPGAETAVFTASAGSKGIDDAVNRSGQRYQALTSAFTFRSSLDAACSCNASSGPKRNHSVLTDFTLRPGDMVMTSEGIKVFQGGSFPYAVSDFSKSDTASMPSQERRWVQAAEASSVRGIAGADLSPALQARIVQQVNAAKGKLTDAPARQVTQAIATVESDASDAPASATVEKRAVRYVGPDKVSGAQP